MKMKRFVGTMMCAMALMACGDDESTTKPGVTGAGGAGGSGGSSAQGGGGGAGGGGSSSACPAGSICFDVKEVQPGTISPGRLVVVWFQPNDDGPDPLPQIAYDAPFDPAANRVTAPVADIAVPVEASLFCERSCDDEAMCPCLSDPKIGIGLIVVAKDEDMSGQIEVTELGTNYGTAFTVLGYSETAYMPALAPLDVLFVEGIQEGILPYRVIEGQPGERDTLGLPTGDAVELNVCPDIQGCEAPVPDLG
jgi:hypothetical protein